MDVKAFVRGKILDMYVGVNVGRHGACQEVVVCIRIFADRLVFTAESPQQGGDGRKEDPQNQPYPAFAEYQPQTIDDARHIYQKNQRKNHGRHDENIVGSAALRHHPAGLDQQGAYDFQSDTPVRFIPAVRAPAEGQVPKAGNKCQEAFLTALFRDFQKTDGGEQPEKIGYQVLGTEQVVEIRLYMHRTGSPPGKRLKFL